MSGDFITLPRIANIGLFDFKLKHGTIPITNKRLVHSYEIELPTHNGGYSYINSKEYPIEDNRIICAKPRQWRRTVPPFNCQYIHIIPNDSEVCKILKELPDTIKLSSRDKYAGLFDDITSEYDRTAHSVSLSLYGKFLILVNELKNDTELILDPKKDGRTSNTKAIEAAVNYIDSNFMYKLTLEGLAKKVYLSPIYFRKLFYDTIGVTPYDYIKDKRIEKAKQLLATTDMALTDIAVNCGFTDQAYFGKVFREVTKDTPRSYRVSINNMYP